MTPPIRLLALDIDGTLLNSSFQISAANLASIRRAREAGVEVMLTTGRRHSFALPIVEMLGFDMWLISSNGAMIRSSQGELFYRDLIPADVVRDLLAHMEQFSRQAVLTFDRETKDALVVEGIEELTASIGRWMEKNAAYIQQVSPLASALTSDPVQAMFCGDIPYMRAAEPKLAGFPRLSEITVLKTEYEARNLSIMDLLNQSCTKGRALQLWAEHRGYDRRHVMAIGDNYNDVEMLEFAGVPVIMGNACEQLKQNGWRITASNDESGVAVALEQLGI